LLKEREVEFNYREYTKEPLSRDELVEVFELLGVEPASLLRKKDAANKELGLTGEEDAETLLDHMAEHPTLLQRPIAILDGKAVIGRPVENLLELL
jgi:arsenate reductase